MQGQAQGVPQASVSAFRSSGVTISNLGMTCLIDGQAAVCRGVFSHSVNEFAGRLLALSVRFRQHHAGYMCQVGRPR